MTVSSKQEDEHMNINCEQYQNKETGKINYIDDMYQLYLQAQTDTDQFEDFDDFLSAVTDQNGLFVRIQ